jgi:hypothetical protein
MQRLQWRISEVDLMPAGQGEAGMRIKATLYKQEVYAGFTLKQVCTF